MISKKHVEDVRAWHNKFLISTVTDVSKVSQFLELRNKIMEEEINEYFDAGVDIVERADALTDMYFIAAGTLALYAEADSKIQGILDGYMRSTFATHVRLLDYLLDLDKNALIKEKLNDLFTEVLRSNHTKADENGEPIFREDGKLLKSNLFEEPDLRKVLFYED